MGPGVGLAGEEVSNYQYRLRHRHRRHGHGHFEGIHYSVFQPLMTLIEKHES